MAAITPQQKIRLLHLRQERATRTEIAQDLGVSLAKVKRWIANLEPDVRARPAPKNGLTNKDNTFIDPDQVLTLMERCKIILGSRMGEDYRGYLLDGRPVNSSQIRKAAAL